MAAMRRYWDLLERISSDVAVDVVELVEIADGLYATRESDGMRSLYYDRACCALKPTSVRLLDEEFPLLPHTLGLIVFCRSAHWRLADVQAKAMQHMQTATGGAISLHSEPIVIDL